MAKTRYWLMKSEPDVFSLDDLKNCPKQTEPWNGVRNYQARNFMRDEMKKGDRVLFYHSNTNPPGVVGLATISSEAAYPDPTQFDAKSDYFDAKSSQETPRWLLVDVTYERHFPTYVSLETLKNTPALKDMKVVQRGQRLSIQPVTEAEFRKVCALGGLSS
jgi:predicted RNA-binding protein with PUA-like domain